MNKETQFKLIDNVNQKLKDIITSKAADYATEDVLSNFKRISEAAKILKIDITKSEGYAMFMVLLKLDRINNLINNNKKPNNESVDDSYFDGINYLKLSYCCWKENQI